MGAVETYRTNQADLGGEGFVLLGEAFLPLCLVSQVWQDVCVVGNGLAPTHGQGRDKKGTGRCLAPPRSRCHMINTATMIVQEFGSHTNGFEISAPENASSIPVKVGEGLADFTLSIAMSVARQCSQSLKAPHPSLANMHVALANRNLLPFRGVFGFGKF